MHGSQNMRCVLLKVNTDECGWNLSSSVIVHTYACNCICTEPYSCVLFLDLQSPLDREVKVEEEKGLGPELGGDRNTI